MNMIKKLLAAFLALGLVLGMAGEASAHGFHQTEDHRCVRWFNDQGYQSTNGAGLISDNGDVVGWAQTTANTYATCAPKYGIWTETEAWVYTRVKLGNTWSSWSYAWGGKFASSVGQSGVTTPVFAGTPGYLRQYRIFSWSSIGVNGYVSTGAGEYETVYSWGG